jgi:hypothetical protein
MNMNATNLVPYLGKRSDSPDIAKLLATFAVDP